MAARWLRSTVILPAIVLGVSAEWTSYQPGKFELVIADGIVGIVLVICGVEAKRRRANSGTGTLMMLAGFVWFAGEFAQVLRFLHRGPLVHLHISYPTGRLRRRLATATVVVAYLEAIVEPWARNDVVTVSLAALVALAAVDVFVRTSGPARRAGIPALAAALAYAAVLAAASLQRLSGLDATEATIVAYDAVVAAVAVVLLVDLLFGRWTEATVADLVVGLGERAATGSLRDQLARALGDPSLVVGYWIAEQDRYVDDAGRPVELPTAGADRAITAIDDGRDRVAVLVHDAVMLDDSQLVGAVTSAARLAVTNAKLQADVRGRLVELAASRRRIVEAADEQRRQLERELSEGAGRRLDAVGRALDVASRAAIGATATELGEAREELRGARAELLELAQGIRPSALGEGGLVAALPALTQRTPVPVELAVGVGRLPPAIEAAVYFVCSEALANVAKHAAAKQAWVSVSVDHEQVLVSVLDDGRGKADHSRGSGLRGLADRVDALGGNLTVDGRPGGGTRLRAAIPLDSRGQT